MQLPVYTGQTDSWEKVIYIIMYRQHTEKKKPGPSSVVHPQRGLLLTSEKKPAGKTRHFPFSCRCYGDELLPGSVQRLGTMHNGPCRLLLPMRTVERRPGMRVFGIYLFCSGINSSGNRLPGPVHLRPLYTLQN